MFTGLVLESSPLSSVEEIPSGLRFKVLVTHARLKEASLGASIAVNGVCLTVVKIDNNETSSCLSFDISPETLSCTNLGSKKPGDDLNLEASLRMGDEIGGHLVSGHVDAVAELLSRKKIGDFEEFVFGAKEAARKMIAPYLIKKGSLALNGVSLTVNNVEDHAFETRWSHMIIPHTLALTNLGSLKVGDLVNIESDMMAKHLERQLSFKKDQ
jgi:riboflavin synthase